MRRFLARPDGSSRARLIRLGLLITALGAVTVGAGIVELPGSRPSVAEIVKAVPGIDVDRVGAADLSSTAAAIDTLVARIESTPGDGAAYRDLGLAFIQWFRETGDPTLLDRADKAFEEARGRLGDDPMVLVGDGTLLLSRHDFTGALETGRRAMEADPRLSAAHAVVTDALVELGRYDEAIAAAERMADLSRGDLPTLARVSYLRELHGDLDGALDAMRLAALRGALDAPPENVAFVLVIVGNLQVATGDREGAAATYDLALERFPNFAPALAAQGRQAVARGDLDGAIRQFERAVEILPLPEYVIALGEARDAAGLDGAAEDAYDLARFQTRLFQASGMIVDLESALFEADHGDATEALALAEVAYTNQPNVKAADALAWALYKNGRLDDAERRMTEALRIGTRDPWLLYHAGVIANAAGRMDDARRYLVDALATDAGWSATGAADAQRILSELGPSASAWRDRLS